MKLLKYGVASVNSGQFRSIQGDIVIVSKWLAISCS